MITEKQQGQLLRPRLHRRYFSHQAMTRVSPITILGLPASITLSTVLNSIKGGAILHHQLLNTLPITGYNTARLVFLHKSSVLVFEEHAQKYPIKFNGLFARVDLVSTPTWPSTAGINAVAASKPITSRALLRLLELYGKSTSLQSISTTLSFNSIVLGFSRLPWMN